MAEGQHVDGSDLDALITAIIKDSSKDMTIREVYDTLTEKGVLCEYHMVYRRMKSLASHRILDSDKRMCLTGGYQFVFRLVSA